MVFISPNTVYEKRVSLGGGTVYIGSVITDKTNLPSDLRSIGLIDSENASELQKSFQMLSWKSGSPSKKVYEAIIDEEINFSTNLSEIDLFQLTLAFNTTPTYTVGTTVSDTTQTGSTASLLKLSDASSVTENMLLEIGLSGASATDKLRRAKSISSNDVTLEEALKEAPTDGTTVKDVTKVEWVLGNASSPQYYGFKYEKKLPILNQKLTIILFKVAVSESVSLSFQDDTKNIIPVTFSATSDPAVESGALGVAWLTAA